MLKVTSPDDNGLANRHSWIDYARGIAIFLVLYRHVLQGVVSANRSNYDYTFLQSANLFLFSFRMPFFFIVSGIFLSKSLSKRGLGDFIKTKGQLLLYPYILWGVIQISIQLLMADYVNADRSYRDYLYIFVLPREIDQFWYLYALFNVSVLYAITSMRFKFNRIIQLAIGIVFFYISGKIAQHNVHGELWKSGGLLYDILHYYIFFALGDVISSYILNKENFKFFSSWKSFFLILPLFVACQWYFLQVNISHHSISYIEDNQPFLFVVIALSGCLFLTVVAFILQRYNTAKWLRMIGFYSLYILLMHVLVSAATRIILIRVVGVDSVPVLLLVCITVGLLAPIFIYKSVTWFTAWWMFTLQKPQNVKATIKETLPLHIAWLQGKIKRSYVFSKAVNTSKLIFTPRISQRPLAK